MPTLLLDTMCGGIRAQLRMCGIDTAYALDRGVEADDEVLALAAAEDRTIVTRDRELAERAEDAILLTAREPADQLAALADAGVDLALPASPERCGRCNGLLDRVPADAETPAYAPDPAAPAGADADRESDREQESDDRQPVWVCRDCGQHFWRGSHWVRVAETLP